MTETETERRSIALAAGKALRAARGRGDKTPEVQREPATEPAEAEAAVEPELDEVAPEAEAADVTEADELADAVEVAQDAPTEVEDDVAVEVEASPVEDQAAPSEVKVEDEAAPVEEAHSGSEWVEITPGRAEASAEPAETRRRGPSALLITGVAALSLALIFAVITGVLWSQATRSPGRTLANDREAVLSAAQFDVVTMNTSDYRNPQAAINQWLSVTTGTMHDQVTQAGPSTAGLIKQAKLITTATIEAAAVTALDPGKGTATVILSVDVSHKPISGAAVVARNRMSAAMTRVTGQWMLSNLGLVSVQLS